MLRQAFDNLRRLSRDDSERKNASGAVLIIIVLKLVNWDVEFEIFSKFLN